MDFSLPSSLKDRGYGLKTYDTLASTMDQAWHYALTSDTVLPPGVWFLAHEQTGGRGRHQRLWYSPKGNLYASLLIPEPGPLSYVPYLCFVTALAVHDALSSLLSQASTPPLRLKWPNDILMGTEKVGGILIESRHVRQEQRLCVVIGIGINCHAAPDTINGCRPATCLSRWTLSLSPALVFHEIAHKVSHRLMAWSKDFRFEAIRQAWLQNAYGLGQPIRVDHPSGSIYGIFSGLDATGRLLCTTTSSKGIIACDSGTVHFLDEKIKD